LRPATNGAMTVRAVYVDPAYRRWGIGTHLLGAAQDQARTHGASTLRTRLAANNPALTLFLGAGYAVCGFLDDETGTWLYLCQPVTPLDAPTVAEEHTA
jgi:GNAT superfamily N-acetyltransferase